MSAGSGPLPPSDPLTLCAVMTAGRGGSHVVADRLFADLAGCMSGLERIVDHRGLRLAMRNPDRKCLRRATEGTAVVIGSLFDSSGADAAQPLFPHGDDIRALAGDLARKWWGSYCAFGLDAKTGCPAVFRDPSGARPLFAWRIDDMLIVADALSDGLIAAAGRKPGIDWAGVAQLMARPPLAACRSTLTDVSIVTPGMLLLWDGSQLHATRIWDPAQVARSAVGSIAAPDAAVHLREAVSSSVGAWARGHDRILLELSGGLDSAILLGCLGRSPHRPEIHCLNIAPHSPGGDESAFARAAAQLHGAPLVETRVTSAELDYRALEQRPRPTQPGIYGADILADRISADVAASLSATMIMTGQGGDAVFFQPASGLVAADYRLDHGVDRRFLSLVHAGAMRMNRSVWSMMAAALFPRDDLDRSAHVRPPVLAGPAAIEGWRSPEVHPWVEAAGDLSPARRLQIALLANCQIFGAPTLTSLTNSRVHPLLSQPVVEACLAIPAYALAPDARDRGLARDAFAALLPPEIRMRRGKGEASGFYNRVIVDHLDWIRPLLLDGLLAEQRLIDRASLELALDVETLMWRDDHRFISLLVVLELWARRWC